MVDLERLVPLQPDGTATPLFCVHSSSGSAFSYLELAQLLGADRPVYGIEAAGFDGTSEPVRSVPAMSAEYAETLREFRPLGDFLLLGWSLGGIIAFDMAHRLTAAGAHVRQLIMVDVSMPWIAELPPEKAIASRFLQEMLASLGVPIAPLTDVLAGLPDEVASEAIFQAAERAGVLPPELDVELLAERYAVFRAHIEASYGYQPTEVYHGPVQHLIASESPLEYLRWDKVATELTEHIVPGNHHSIWSGDSLLRLAELVRAALAEPVDQPSS